MSRLEGREAGAKHRAEGEPVRWRPRRGHAQMIDNQYFIKISVAYGKVFSGVSCILLGIKVEASPPPFMISRTMVLLMCENSGSAIKNMVCRPPPTMLFN